MSQPAGELNGAETNELLAEPADGGIVESLGLNVQLFAWQLFNFALVALVVWRLILRPLVKKMEERKKIVDESLDKAHEIEMAFAKSQEKYKETVDAARTEANMTVSRAHDEAAALSARMKAEAKADIDGLVAAAKKNIARERETMQAQFKVEMVGLVVAVVEKVLGEKLDAEKDEKLIAEAVEGIDRVKDF